MGIFNKLSKADFPDVSEIGNIPVTMREGFKRGELNRVTVRYFNSDFSEVIESVGKIDYTTSIPMIYFEIPFKGGIILLDKTIYSDKARCIKCIDIVEGYIFGLDKKVDIVRQLEGQYYNDCGNGKIDKEIAEKLREESGIGYYVPVLLNSIPIPIIKLKQDISLKVIDIKQVTLLTEVTQRVIRQLADNKLLSRTGKGDNTVLVYVSVLFTLIGVVLGMIFLGLVAF